MMITEAIKYVKENKTWNNTDEAQALSKMSVLTSPLSVADPTIYEGICDLMDEYCSENNIEADLWRDEITADEILFEL